MLQVQRDQTGYKLANRNFEPDKNPRELFESKFYEIAQRESERFFIVIRLFDKILGEVV